MNWRVTSSALTFRNCHPSMIVGISSYSIRDSAGGGHPLDASALIPRLYLSGA